MIIPTPITEILETFFFKINLRNLILLLALIILFVLLRSSVLIVNVKSVSFPFAEIFWTTISTFIKFFESGLKIDAATPGLSLTPINEIFESFWVDVMPVTILWLEILDLFVINVPDFFLKDDFTSISILFNLASWIDTGCITLAPREAISNISSYEITLIFLALFNLFGSVV